MSRCRVCPSCMTTIQILSTTTKTCFTMIGEANKLYSGVHSYILTPVRSQSRMVLKEPTANISPLGAHDNEAIGES